MKSRIQKNEVYYYSYDDEELNKKSIRNLPAKHQKDIKERIERILQISDSFYFSFYEIIYFSNLIILIILIKEEPYFRFFKKYLFIFQNYRKQILDFLFKAKLKTKSFC